MKIVVAGAGRVGFRLAESLSISNDVIIVDSNPDAVERAAESLDLMAIEGSIEDPDTFKKLPGKKFDLFIALTDSDEVNIISTLIADDEIEVSKKIIRLKNPYFAKSAIAKKIGIDEAVFPYILSASSIEAVLDLPAAENVKEFPFGDYGLYSFRAKRELKIKDSEKAVAVAIERDGKIDTKNRYEIKKGDLVYVLSSKEEIKKLSCEIVGDYRQKIKTAAIFGAGRLGIEIAKSLSKRKLTIKLIDSDPKRCASASEELQENVMVINSRYIEKRVFEEERVVYADLVVAAEENDERNIVRSLEAKEYGIKKCVCINNNLEYYPLMHRLDLTTVRGPKTSAYYSILEKIGSDFRVSEKHFCGGSGTVLMRKIFEDSALIFKEISPLPDEEIGTFLIREGKISPLERGTILKKGDIIAVFSNSKWEERIKKWIYTL